MKFSIVTTTYNSAQTLFKCISSLKNQTYKNIELIWIDNSSKDSTYKILNTVNFKMGSETIMVSLVPTSLKKLILTDKIVKMRILGVSVGFSNNITSKIIFK